jgi:hypothetical protein
MGRVIDLTRPGGALCGAPKKDATKCKQPAGAGTDHLGFGRCKYHGGNSPSHRNAAARETVAFRHKAFGTPIDVDPGTALLMEVRRSAGIVQWLGEVIAEFTTELDLAGGAREARDAVQTLGEQGRAAAVWVDLYFRERKNLASVAKMALDAGVAERQVQLQEEQGRLLANVIQAILNDLNLTVEQRTIVPGVVRKHMLAIEAAS